QPDRPPAEGLAPFPAEHDRRRRPLPLRPRARPGAAPMTDEEKPETPSLEKRVTSHGRHVGDRYVRIVRPVGSGLRGHGGRYLAPEATMPARGPAAAAVERVAQLFIGKRLESEAEAEERGGVRTGLPLLPSDN